MSNHITEWQVADLWPQNAQLKLLWLC